MFTIGLWHHHRFPEIVMAGLRPQDMHVWLNNIAADLRSGTTFAFNEPVEGVIDDYDVTFRPIDGSWLATLVGYTAVVLPGRRANGSAGLARPEQPLSVGRRRG